LNSPLVRKDVVVTPKETVTWVIATQGRPNVPTVTTLPPPVRVPIVTSDPTYYGHQVIQPVQQETVVPHATHVPVPAPVVRIEPISNPIHLSGTLTSYVTTSPVVSPGVTNPMFAPTPVEPPESGDRRDTRGHGFPQYLQRSNSTCTAMRYQPDRYLLRT